MNYVFISQLSGTQLLKIRKLLLILEVAFLPYLQGAPALCFYLYLPRVRVLLLFLQTDLSEGTCPVHM